MELGLFHISYKKKSDLDVVLELTLLKRWFSGIIK